MQGVTHANVRALAAKQRSRGNKAMKERKGVTMPPRYSKPQFTPTHAGSQPSMPMGSPGARMEPKPERRGGTPGHKGQMNKGGGMPETSY